MQIKNATLFGRTGWLLDNARLRMFVMRGGGHIAGLELAEASGVNPYWIPPWKSLEPGRYTARSASQYGEKLLACIAGHNLCLGTFGPPSADELKAGMGCHGEAPVVEWKETFRRIGPRDLAFSAACELPEARMRFSRSFFMRHGAASLRVRETLESLSKRDMPFTMCQHVTLGPPFLEPGVTLCDMPAVKGMVFPGKFSERQRLRSGAQFKWPHGPGLRGTEDLRRQGKTPHSDFSTQLLNPAADNVWFSAVNPALGLALAYYWRRADWPWLGIWDENNARRAPPWRGKTTARGMEFANSPFPESLKDAVTRSSLFGVPTFQWLPAMGRLQYTYFIAASAAPHNCKGVKKVEITEDGPEFEFVS